MFYLLTVRCSTCTEETEALLPVPTGESLTCRRCKSALAKLEVVSGFVYVLSSPGIPGLVKIGFTESSVDERVRQLSSSTSIPVPFVVEAYFLSTNPLQDEQSVHQRLASCRKPGREFFEMTAEAAIAAVTAVVGREAQFIRARPFREYRCFHCCYVWSAPVRESEEEHQRCPSCGRAS